MASFTQYDAQLADPADGEGRTGEPLRGHPMAKTIDDGESEFEQGYACGAEAARAALAGDLRAVVDHINSELRALRREVCRAAGLPLPDRIDPLDAVNGRGRPQ